MQELLNKEVTEMALIVSPFIISSGIDVSYNVKSYSGASGQQWICEANVSS